MLDGVATSAKRGTSYIVPVKRKSKKRIKPLKMMD
jgi:hypothetical protein